MSGAKVTKKMIATLRKLLAEATPCADVQISWYWHDGINHPQFETERGGIAQEPADYELYCAARNTLPALLDELDAWRSAAEAVGEGK